MGNLREITNEAGNRLLIFGLGSIGKLVAEKSKSFCINNDDVPYFDHVLGTTRGSKLVDGIQVINFTSDEFSSILPTCTHILVTVPPIDSDASTNSTQNLMVGGRPRRWKYFCDPILNHPNLFFELVPRNTWVGYISTTSVYGNHDGQWVTEQSKVKCKPGSKGELYYRAEDEWKMLASKCGWRMHIFRCAGLYGNERSALHTLIKSGGRDRTAFEPASNAIEYPTSRIHEEDATRAIIHAMNCNQTAAGECCIWNLADDNPAPRSEVMSYGSRLLQGYGIKLHQKNSYSTQKPIQRDKRRQSESKRISNQRMKSALLPDGKLMYPTYQEGLKYTLNNNRDNWT